MFNVTQRVILLWIIIITIFYLMFTATCISTVQPKPKKPKLIIITHMSAAAKKKKKVVKGRHLCVYNHYLPLRCVSLHVQHKMFTNAEWFIDSAQKAINHWNCCSQE